MIISGDGLLAVWKDGRRREGCGCWRARSFQFGSVRFDEEGVKLTSLGVVDVRSEGEVPIFFFPALLPIDGDTP